MLICIKIALEGRGFEGIAEAQQRGITLVQSNLKKKKPLFVIDYICIRHAHYKIVNYVLGKLRAAATRQPSPYEPPVFEVG